MEEKLKILKEKKQKYLLEKIFKIPERVKEREKRVEVFLAFEPSPDFVKELEQNIKKKLKEEKEIKIKVDKNLISGMRIKTKNILIKGSLRDFFEKIKNVNF